MSEITVGPGGGDHIAIRVLRRMHPQANDYWDGNWVDAEVVVDIRPWRATYRAYLRTDEFAQFRDQLRELYDGARKEASFAPMEPWLGLTLELDSLGHITLRGKAGPEGSGKIFGQVHLDFELKGVMDQTYLPPLIAQLDELEREFPVRGSPKD